MVFRHCRRFEGQTLQEYVVIGGLLMLVAIGGMMVAGQNLNSFFQALFGDMRNHTVAATQASAPALQPGVTAVEPVQTDTPSPSEQDLTVSIDGQNLVVPVVIADPAVTVQTAGAAGATREYALLLEKIIGQMQEAGTLDSSASEILKALANQGHKMADVESMVEKAISEGRGDEPLVYDGVQYENARALLRTVGFANEESGNVDFSNKSCAAVLGSCPGVYLANFEVTRDRIRDMPFMNDRQTRRVVERIGIQIRQIANGMSVGLESNNNQPIPQQTIEEMSQKTASSMTNTGSVVICDAGDRNDTGIHCE